MRLIRAVGESRGGTRPVRRLGRALLAVYALLWGAAPIVDAVVEHGRRAVVTSPVDAALPSATISAAPSCDVCDLLHTAGGELLKEAAAPRVVIVRGAERRSPERAPPRPTERGAQSRAPPAV